MLTEARKIHLLEEVLKVDSEATLEKLQSVLDKAKKEKKAKFSAHDLAGTWSKKDSSIIRKAIQEGCESINEDDWK